MSQRIITVDSFSNTPFSGNPAAVCVMEEAGSDEWMQQVAAEINLSETAFLFPEADGYRLRWFTPATEVKLCGHATLASAHVLWEEGHVRRGTTCTFHTLSGILTAEPEGDFIAMNFPANPAKVVKPAPGLADALGSDFEYVGVNEPGYCLVGVGSEEVLRGLSPDFRLLAELPYFGVGVTTKSATGDYDFVSRFFAPRAGIDEDPVTGSAYCMWGSYWGERLGKTSLRAYQASARGGEVRVRLEGERVVIAGQAITTMRGELV